MANWTTEWITHPDYPGWRKRRLVDPKTGMHAMLGTFWERIPGSDPNLPGPPGSERHWGGIFPDRPDWGKRPEFPEWPDRKPFGPTEEIEPLNWGDGYPGDPEGREPKPPYRPPFGTHEMPGIPDKPERPPGWHNLPEKFPDWHRPFPFFPRWKDKDIKPTPMPWKPWGEWGPEREILPYFSDGRDKWMQLLENAKLDSELRRENIMIPPGKRKRYPAEFDPATGQNRVVPGTLRTIYPDEERVTGPQLGGVPEGDREFVDTMHNIQNAYFTGADFGYEEGWPEQLGATQEQIDMFMAVPEEAFQHAMDNPTDAVLQQFEEYYGFPLNVNDPDMQKYFGDRKKKR